MGLAFGVALAILRVLIGAQPFQWHVTQRRWVQLLVSSTLGVVWATLIWGTYHSFILERQLMLTDWGVFLVGGVILSSGFITARLAPRLIGWVRLLIHTVVIFVPIYIMAQQAVS